MRNLLDRGTSDDRLDAAYERELARELPPEEPPTDDEIAAMYAAWIAEGHADAR